VIGGALADVQVVVDVFVLMDVKTHVRALALEHVKVLAWVLAEELVLIRQVVMVGNDNH